MDHSSAVRRLICRLSGLALPVMIGPAAFAHPGHGGAQAGFADGLLHPLTGLDHLLAMVGVGLLAYLLGGRVRWAMPAGFVGMMAIGAGLAGAGFALPYVETAVAFSVLAVGAMLTLGRAVPAVAAIAVAGIFALFHGQAHMGDFAGAAPYGAVMAGMLLATAGLHALGLAGAVLLDKTMQHRAAIMLRGGGGALSIAGVALIALA